MNVKFSSVVYVAVVHAPSASLFNNFILYGIYSFTAVVEYAEKYEAIPTKFRGKENSY